MIFESLVSQMSRLPSRFSIQDQAWFQFVDDHKDVLRDTASMRDHQVISSEIMVQYQYDLEGYLRLPDVKSTPEIAWIVRLINGLKSNRDFVGVTELIVPSISFIETWYSKYQSSKNAS